MNHEPTKLALLISLICAGASVDALAKTEGATDLHRPSQEACAPVRALAAPQDWPLILNGIRDAEAGSLGLSLSASAAHELWLPWRGAEAVGAAVVVAEVEAIEPAVQKRALQATEAEPIDPLEAANAAASLVDVVAAAPTSAKAAVAGQHRVEKPKEFDPSRHAVLRAEREVPSRGKLFITPSAQRVMRDLAAIRFHALETLDSPVGVEVATTAPAPMLVPTSSTMVLDPTPSATVLVTLSEVLTSPDVAAAVMVGDAADSATDEISLEAAIAARREVKRMKQRARAEAAVMAQQAEMAAATTTTANTSTTPATTPATTPTTARSNPFGAERMAVHDNALDRVRGGFVSNNLNIAFGIERAVYINGSLVTTTSLNISDTGRVSSGVTSGVDSKGLTPGTLALIQSGAGNSVASGAFSSSSGAGLNANAIGTVVQNTLDGQKIQNITVINATANSLGVLRDLNLQNSLRNSLIDSLRR